MIYLMVGQIVLNFAAAGALVLLERNRRKWVQRNETLYKCWLEAETQLMAEKLSQRGNISAVDFSPKPKKVPTYD